MTKKSHKVAAKYSALSREKKRKQHAKPPPGPGVAPPKTDHAIEGPEPPVREASRTAMRPRREPALVSPGHVKGDLKRIATIAGSIIVVLIILSFVLR